MTQVATHDGWPQPYNLPDAQPYWEGLAAGEIRFQHCQACKQPVWPAHSFCPHCEGTDIVWQRANGNATLYSFSTIMRGPTPVWQGIAPYTVGFVEMEEGYYLFAQIDIPDSELKIGARLKAKLVLRGAQQLPIFVKD